MCSIIDQAIHRSYEIFTINYVAYDILHNTKRFSRKYSDEEQRKVVDYIEKQLDKVELSDITAEERDFMREMMLVMYANPLKNKLKTILGE